METQAEAEKVECQRCEVEAGVRGEVSLAESQTQQQEPDQA